ncbi:MAG: TdeIII family type II restriction endonuclease [Treponema sp.]|jgi:hypothetical protein|nr:TdeIII family type II restriction endonuclease [Treponema sp.]
MSLSKTIHAEINELIDAVVQKYISKASEKPKANSGNPFVMAIVKDFDPLIHRIHGLRTSLGNEMEKIAQIIANDAWGRSNVRRKVKEAVILPKNVLELIDTIINNLNNPKTLSNYAKEKEMIIEACKNPSKNTEKQTFEFDLVITDPKSNHTYILEMKGPDPNTTEVPGAKRRLLVAIAWAYFKTGSECIDSQLAIYYNNEYPKVYKNSKVYYYFDPKGGTIVQEDFWNFLGKNEQTFISLTNMFETYGKINKKKIWERFSKLIEVQ